MNLESACPVCRTSFSKNEMFQAAPFGREFVVDCLAKRAWSVCPKCGHWTYLGPVTSTQFVRELSPFTPPNTDCRLWTEEIGHAKVHLFSGGSLPPVSNSYPLKYWKLLRNRNRLSLLGDVVFIGLLVLATRVISDGVYPTWIGIAQTAQVVATVAAAWWTASSVHSIFDGSKSVRRLVAHIAAAGTVAAVVSEMPTGGYRLGAMLGLQIWAGLTIGFAAIFWLLPASYQFGDSSHKWISRRRTNRLVLDTVPSRAIRLRDVATGELVDEYESLLIVSKLVADAFGYGSQAPLERAWGIARQHLDAHSLVRSLASSDEQPIYISRLPKHIGIALGLLAIQRLGSPLTRLDQTRLSAAHELATIEDELHAETDELATGGEQNASENPDSRAPDSSQ